MSWNVTQGQHLNIKVLIKQRWSRLTDDDLLLVEGEREALVGRIQERYGIPRNIAERQVEDMEQLFLRYVQPPSLS